MRVIFLSGVPLHKHTIYYSYIIWVPHPQTYNVLHLYPTCHSFLCVSYSWADCDSTSTLYIKCISYDESFIHKHMICYSEIIQVTHSCVCHILERITIPQAHYTLNVYHMSPSSTKTWYVTLKPYKSLILVCVIFLSGVPLQNHMIHYANIIWATHPHTHVMSYTYITRVTHSNVCLILERDTTPQAHDTIHLHHMRHSSTHTHDVLHLHHTSHSFLCNTLCITLTPHIFVNVSFLCEISLIHEPGRNWIPCHECFRPAPRPHAHIIRFFYRRRTFSGEHIYIHIYV